MPSMTEATPMTDPRTNPVTGPMILAEGIHKRFGSNEVLKGVSLAAKAGDVDSVGMCFVLHVVLHC